jgi:cell division protein FtsW
MKAPQTSHKGKPDFILLIMTLILVGFGIVMVFSASSSIAVVSSSYNHDALYFTKRQLIYAVAGLFAMFFLMNLPYQFIRKNAKYFVLPVMFMLFTVPFLGVSRNGATSWYEFGPITIQPTEFAKLALILILGKFIIVKGEQFRTIVHGLIPTSIIIIAVAGITMIQPDYGSAFILIMTACVMVWAGGANLKQIFSVGSIVVIAVSGFLFLAYLINPESWDYRFARVLAYQHPEKYMLDESWHLVSSLQALAHGGFMGAGFGEGIQKLHYLQYAYNDFIFAVIGEEFGFIGSTFFILFFLFFIWRGFTVAVRCPDSYGLVVGVGIMGLMAVQAFVNIAGVTGFIPMTGVTLPFISAGGSSLLVSLMAIGVLLSISREYNKQSQTKIETVSTKTRRETTYR